MPRPLALLLGVSDYAPYELATGRPLGSVRLRGAVHDALGYARMLRRLGVAPADVRLLLSPAPTAEMVGLDALPVAEATTAAIREGFAWLGRELAADPGALAIVTWSGHGDLTAEGDYRLHPADSTGAGLSLRELAAALPSQPGAASCVLLLETCRTGATGTPDGDAIPPLAAVFRPEDTIILSAAAPGQRAMERCIDGRWQGVFAWAVQRVVEQWTAAPAGQGFGLSYAELHARAARIVEAIGVSGTQTPALLAREDHRDAPFLGLRGAGGTVSAEPTAAKVGSELPAGTVGLLSLSPGVYVGAFEVVTSVSTTRMDWYGVGGNSPFASPQGSLFDGFTLELFPDKATATSGRSLPSFSYWGSCRAAGFSAQSDPDPINPQNGYPNERFVGAEANGHRIALYSSDYRVAKDFTWVSETTLLTNHLLAPDRSYRFQRTAAGPVGSTEVQFTKGYDACVIVAGSSPTF